MIHPIAHGGPIQCILQTVESSGVARGLGGILSPVKYRAPSLPPTLSEVKKKMGIFPYKVVKTDDFLRVLPPPPEKCLDPFSAPPPLLRKGWLRHWLEILARIPNGIFVNRNFRLKIVLTKIGFI